MKDEEIEEQENLQKLLEDPEFDPSNNTNFLPEIPNTIDF